MVNVLIWWMRKEKDGYRSQGNIDQILLEQMVRAGDIINIDKSIWTFAV